MAISRDGCGDRAAIPSGYLNSNESSEPRWPQIGLRKRAMCILAMSLALARRQPLTTDSLRIVFVLLVGLGTGICFAAESASSSASQADINNEAQAAYQAGTAAAANNDFKTAEAQFEKVVRLVPQIEEGHSALGAVLAHLGKLPQAIKELETALRLKPGDISAQTNLALAYEQTGANQKAIFLLRVLKPMRSASPPFRARAMNTSRW